MSSDMNLTITGIQQAQAANLKMMADLKPSGGFGKAVWQVTMSLHRYAVSITHVVTGALRASHRTKFDGLVGQIYIDRSSINPRNKARPYRYGFYEEGHGGTHAFYKRTVDEAAAQAVNKATRGMF